MIWASISQTLIEINKDGLNFTCQEAKQWRWQTGFGTDPSLLDDPHQLWPSIAASTLSSAQDCSWHSELNRHALQGRWASLLVHRGDSHQLHASTPALSTHSARFCLPSWNRHEWAKCGLSHQSYPQQDLCLRSLEQKEQTRPCCLVFLQYQ